ncbi:MAG: NAD(P)H-hydrate dehydratase [Desulfovibrio sp.]|nr:NAD(P)H-hydrate dehydratase [Desulfovibrio sp.]
MDSLSFFAAQPNLFAPLPSAQLMSQWDHQAQELGLDGTVLMENASRSAFQELFRQFPDLEDLDVALVIGSGNNGGDAAVIGRYLQATGVSVTAYLIKPLSDYQGTCAKQLALAQKLGLPLCDLQRLLDGERRCDLLIDGILGTGFKGPLRDDLASLIATINALQIPRVVSVDIPSGLSADTGQPLPQAIVADLTLCMSACKKGLVLPCAKAFTGRIKTLPIGLPALVREARCAQHYLLDERLGQVPAALPANSHKNRFGHVGILGGGDRSHTGAAHLACRAALRAGAGLVSAIVKEPLASAIQLNLAEIMLCPLNAPHGFWPDTLPVSLQALLPKLSAIVIGPGYGLGEDACDFLQLLLSLPKRPPLVLDADALTLLANHPELMDKVEACDVLTPHPGEAAALLKTKSQDIQNDRYAALAALTANTRAVVVLKGAGTLLGQKGLPVLVSPWDLPALAIAGAGDVLAGLLGCLLAQKNDQLAALSLWLAAEPKGAFLRRLYALPPRHKPANAKKAPCRIPEEAADLLLAALAVNRHALAAQELCRAFPQRGFLAHELADALGRLPC